MQGRWILIESNSGYVWGDSADLDGRIFNGTPEEFARALDESVGAFGRSYEEAPWAAGRDGAPGYYVYRADVDGSEAVPVVVDGQDQDTIDAVEQNCAEVCFVKYFNAE